jgi:hypothetical protein
VPEHYLTLSKSDQSEVLEQARERTGRPAHLLEKDVWVVWTLGVLFEGSLAADLTFKGGNTLANRPEVSAHKLRRWLARTVTPNPVEYPDSGQYLASVQVTSQQNAHPNGPSPRANRHPEKLRKIYLPCGQTGCRTGLVQQTVQIVASTI